MAPGITMLARSLVFGLVALAGSVLALFALPTAADACACCDGYTTRHVLGWSASGGSVLVDNETAAGCEQKRFLEVYRAGVASPSVCYDLYSTTPDRRAICDFTALSSSYDDATGGWRTVGTSTRPRLFPQAARTLSARYVRASLSPASGDTSAEDLLVLEVEVLGSAGWQRVHRAEVRRYVYSSPADGSVEHRGLSVTVWPAPDGRRALLHVGSVESAPGLGHADELLAWVTLPAGAPVVAGAPSDLPRLALPRPTQRRSDAELRTLSIRANRAGMESHRAGDHRRSADAFARAAFLDSGNVVARTNLACALARLGALERSVGLLEELAEVGCPRCVEGLREVLDDADLAALRGTPPFERLVASLRRRATD